MTVTVRFAGLGDSFGSGGRFQTCIVVDGPASRFAIDFGTSSLIALAQQGIEPNPLDAILLSASPIFSRRHDASRRIPFPLILSRGARTPMPP